MLNLTSLLFSSDNTLLLKVVIVLKTYLGEETIFKKPFLDDMEEGHKTF